MKWMKMGVFLAVCLLVVSGIALAQGTEARYLVKSDSGLLKAMLGVQHNFDNGFTAELTSGQLRALERLGVELEEVPLYHTLVKPVCGDNICQGNEPKSCPTDCSGIPDPDPEPEPGRSCVPSSQMPYGVMMVNGGSGGAGINVAILDTGVKVDHLDLDVKLCADASKRGIKKGCADTNGHGTHVAGTVAANGGSDSLGIWGVAPEANLWMVKVCGPTGCWSDDIAEAIRYVADQGANVVSMSLGGDVESSLVRDAIDYAAAKGVLVVAAAGNDGPAEGSIDYPGANVKVMAVGAIDVNENVASWSSRGVNDGDFVIEEREVELAAPGVAIESTSNTGCYTVMSGTSMATPHVAGLAAKVWQGDALSTRAYLQQLARNHDLHTLGDDSATGLGLPMAS
ncbi:S8 family peptidase [Candidatus Woesearchaeota archaeon]|nr:S8 family peptidase [Candidatus Woesearchaeota archaeon]